MALQKRRYVIRSVRRGGRVVTQYLGRAGAAAEYHRLGECTQRQLDWALERARLELLEQPLETLNVALDVLVRAMFHTHGYHQHARGQWRKKRHGTSKEI